MSGARAASAPAADAGPEPAPAHRSVMGFLADEAETRRALAEALADGLVGFVDLGGHEVKAALGRSVAAAGGARTVRLVAHAVAPSRGVRAGGVIDIEQAGAAIARALEAAEAVAGVGARHVVATVSGGYPRSHVLAGEAAVAAGRVEAGDLARALATVRAPAEMEGRLALHAAPTLWTLDGEALSGETRAGAARAGDPRGLSGRRLGLDLHLLTLAEDAVEALAGAVEAAGRRLLAPVAGPYAAALGALEAEEAEAGAAVVDLGAGATGVAILRRGRLCFADVLRVGGEQATLDVARAFEIGRSEAEARKRAKGALALRKGVPPAEARLSATLRARLVETLELARDRLAAAGYPYLPTPRVVLVGGGARADGALEVAQSVFGRAVRIGAPRLGDDAPGPTGAALAGLLAYAADALAADGPDAAGSGAAWVSPSRKSVAAPPPTGALGGLVRWLKDGW